VKHYAEATLRPQSHAQHWQYDALHGRGCGRTYEVRYTVLTGAKGSPRAASHHYGPYAVAVGPS
jgi:hypothetical protein